MNDEFFFEHNVFDIFSCSTTSSTHVNFSSSHKFCLKMTTFTLLQKIFIVKNYYQSGNSTKSVQNEFPNSFEMCAKPGDEDILHLIKLFEEFGNVCAENDKRFRTRRIPRKKVVKPPPKEVNYLANNLV